MSKKMAIVMATAITASSLAQPIGVFADSVNTSSVSITNKAKVDDKKSAVALHTERNKRLDQEFKACYPAIKLIVSDLLAGKSINYNNIKKALVSDPHVKTFLSNNLTNYDIKRLGKRADLYIRKDSINKFLALSKNFKKSRNVILINKDQLSDILAVAPLVMYMKCPILVIDKNSVSDSVKEELARLKAKNVVLIGTKKVISKSVEKELKDDYKLKRVAGHDRYEIAKLIANNYHRFGIKKAYVYDNAKAFVDELPNNIKGLKLKAIMAVLDEDSFAEFIFKGYYRVFMKAKADYKETNFTTLLAKTLELSDKYGVRPYIMKSLKASMAEVSKEGSEENKESGVIDLVTTDGSGENSSSGSNAAIEGTVSSNTEVKEGEVTLKEDSDSDIDTISSAASDAKLDEDVSDYSALSSHDKDKHNNDVDDSDENDDDDDCEVISSETEKDKDKGGFVSIIKKIYNSFLKVFGFLSFK